MESCSQSFQDFFALSIAKNNTYIEIGANQPKYNSNTYNLETSSWKGFSLELNRTGKIEKAWKFHSERTNTVYWENALKFNYMQGIAETGMSTHVGYLSCDIEPPSNTFKALKKVISQGISFDCITFEHDRYQNPTEKDYNVLATEFLISNGYKVAVTDVYVGDNQDQVYETWFVHNSIEFEPRSYAQWKKENNL
jgi:hypothetical protein